MKLRHIGAEFKVVYRSYARNPVALFFSLVFPIILISLFGLIFSSVGSSPAALYVVNDDQGSAVSGAFLSALSNTTVVSVHVVQVNASGFASWLGQNDYPVGLLIPAGFAENYTHNRTVNVTVFTDPADAASSGAVLGAVQGVVNEFNLHSACGLRPSCPTVVGIQLANVGSPVYKYIDYLIPGLIGFSILTSPMFSLVDVSSSYRKEGIFRQLSLTPLTRSEWLAARVVWYVLLTFISAGIMIGAGIGLFGAHVTLTLGVLPFLVVGPFFFVSLGMLCGSAARTPESAALIGNIVTFPMMFLSGTFFTVSSFPPGLQTFAHVLPLYYVIDGLNQVMLFANAGRALVDLLVVLVSSVVVFVAAVRLFKWRDE
jgi:ABC-2 type transport system permease protein